MSEVELANELTFLDKIEDMMKGRRAAVEAEAEARVKNGQHLPGFHMEERRGHAKFTVSRETVKVLTGIDPVNEKLMTPGEAVEAGADPAVIGRLSARPTLKPKLKPVPEGFYTTLFPKL
jgi:orotidine-5'-phosphate decarboxylase